MPELHFWVGLDPRLAICTANGKVPHQKPGVMVGHLYSSAKQLVQGLLVEKLARLEVGTGWKTSQHHCWGQKYMYVYLRNKMIQQRNFECSFVVILRCVLFRHCFGAVADQPIFDVAVCFRDIDVSLLKVDTELLHY